MKKLIKFSKYIVSIILLLSAIISPVAGAEEQEFSLDFPGGKFWRDPQTEHLVHLTIIEKKNINRTYSYRFIIHNAISPKRGSSVVFKEYGDAIANWGLITYDKEALSQLTCSGNHYYNKKNILKCRPDPPNVKLEDSFHFEIIGKMDADIDVIEKSNVVTDFFLPGSIESNSVFIGRGHFPEDGLVIGFKWGFTGPGNVRMGESLGGFGFTMDRPLNRKKIRFWAFFDEEFPNKNIQFIEEKE